MAGTGYRSRLHLCIAALLTTASASQPESPNANHIFNAIHSSKRQWGSSLNHNGMSFFLATVSEGTRLYHGDWQSDPIQGPEWLAFEPEHALVFNHRFPHKPPRDGSPLPPPFQQESQQVIDQADEVQDGFLHTFAAAKDLRLLYVDGMSAGKTTNGTMDSQDHILFKMDQEGGGGWNDEHKRAELFCSMAQEKWDGRLDGLLRMEAGFEIILCDFSDLEVLKVARVRPSDKGVPGVPGVPGGDIGMRARRLWLPVVASRYWKIGGDRVRLNYEHLVTAYSYGLDLFPDGELSLPRLEHLSSGELEPLGVSTDWQAVADMADIEDIVTPFIDYDQRNTSIEVERCSKQFVRRPMPVNSVAALGQSEYDFVVDQIQGLMRYLAWTTWKDCNGCGDHEICMIPMWPMGIVDDYNHPQCRDFAKLDGDGPRYWGGGPRRRESAPPLAL
ncbi:hypothetical protein BJX70DRAFT_385528 [Aspergillus crustosus]